MAILARLVSFVLFPPLHTILALELLLRLSLLVVILFFFFVIVALFKLLAFAHFFSSLFLFFHGHCSAAVVSFLLLVYCSH